MFEANQKGIKWRDLGIFEGLDFRSGRRKKKGGGFFYFPFFSILPPTSYVCVKVHQIRPGEKQKKMQKNILFLLCHPSIPFLCERKNNNKNWEEENEVFYCE
jgi:hypothetical protein